MSAVLYTEVHKGFTFNLFEIDGDPCCAKMELQEGITVVRQSHISRIHMSGLAKEWKNGVDTLIRLSKDKTIVDKPNLAHNSLLKKVQDAKTDAEYNIQGKHR